MVENENWELMKTLFDKLFNSKLVEIKKNLLNVQKLKKTVNKKHWKWNYYVRNKNKYKKVLKLLIAELLKRKKDNDF